MILLNPDFKTFAISEEWPGGDFSDMLWARPQIEPKAARLLSGSTFGESPKSMSENIASRPSGLQAIPPK